MDASDSGWISGGWRSQHQDCCRVGRPEGLELALLGDSLIQGWGGPDRRVAAVGSEHWERFFGGRRAGNLGVAGDRVRHLRWRVEHGALSGIAPREVLLLAGTNDLADGAAPETVAADVLELGRLIQGRLPRATLLIHAILPRGATSGDPLATAVRATNALLAAGVAALGPRARFLDLCDVFEDERGAPAEGLFQDDALHLTAAGYEAWGRALEPLLAPPPPSFADGAPRALERGWILAERAAGMIACGTIALGSAIALGVCFYLEIVESPLSLILVAAWAVLAPLLLWIAARWPQWEYPRTGYRVLPDRIEAWRGLFWRKAWSVPCARVQFTDVSQGPIQRKHGIATLMIHTAGTASSEVSVPGLPHALALEIRDWLVNRTADDAV